LSRHQPWSRQIGTLYQLPVRRSCFSNEGESYSRILSRTNFYCSKKSYQI